MKITIESKLYPESLKKVDKPPKQLWLEGNIKLLEIPGIAIIGSRKCTSYGKEMADKFSRELSSYGLTIISGMAEGIDSFAHKGSIEIGGKTIAVLPCGFKNIYPKSNINLYKSILENNGLILSEYKEDVKADSKKFLERNRIVSGLSIGILVIEGGYRRGTSVTAKLAKKQEKKVFCIPSNLTSNQGITPNKLIKTGNYLVTNVSDIIYKYPELNLSKKKLKKVPKINKKIDEEFEQIYNLLDKKNEIHINEIVRMLNLNIDEVNYKLMMMELEDKIVSLPGNYFKKT